MTNTYDRLANSLKEVLKEHDFKVIVLSGKWGTGKTYLWKQLESEQFANADRPPLYVSLFGVRSVRDFKFEIIGKSTSIGGIAGDLAKAALDAASAVAKKVSGVSLDDLPLLSISKIMAERLIVIDDVERRHKSLDIDELLGFIGEHSETNGTRFLLLLNADKLDEPSQQLWRTLHEKVVDVEVVLNPSASEAFDVAAKNTNCLHLSSVKMAVATLGISNIRVINRIFRVVSTITSTVKCDGVPLERWIPSTVLLTGIHYRGIENPPPFEYIRDFNSFARAFERVEGQRSDDEIRWDSILTALGISVPDQLESIIFEYLQSGVLASNDLSSYFEQCRRDSSNGDIATRIRNFLDRFWWDQSIDESGLIAIAEEFIKVANQISPSDVTDIASVLDGELRAQQTGLALVNAWIASADGRPEYKNLTEGAFDYHRSIHPLIAKKLQTMKDMQNPPLTIVEAVERIYGDRSWGNRERDALQRSTVSQYVEVLKGLTGEPLGSFIREHSRWYRDSPIDESFAHGLRQFLMACQQVCDEQPDSRLAKIIRRALKSGGLDKELSDEQSGAPKH